MNIFFFFQSNAGFDFTKLIAPGITFIGFLIAIYQLSKNNLTRKADFAHRLDVEFFTSDTMACFDLLKYMTFVEPNVADRISHFNIDRVEVDNLGEFDQQLKDFAANRHYCISASDLTFLLLGKLEKIGLYGKQKVVDQEFIYELFGHYFSGTFTNNEIKRYLKWAKENAGIEDICDNLEFMYYGCKKYEEKKNKRCRQ